MTSGTGICSLTADQPGDANYNAAPQATQSTTAVKANQTITVNTPAPANAVYNTSFTVAATASSSLAVSYSASGVCSNTLATFTMTSGTGTCTVKFDQAGDSNYNAATEITESVTAQKANQTITFTGAPANAVYNSTFGVTASASSGLAVTLGASGACSISGTTVTMTSGTGICSLTADQAGNINYNTAPQSTQSTSAQKTNALINVTPYNVTYDGSAHTATGSAKGVETPTPADLSSLLHLGGTTHTNPGDYATDPWTFDGNSNYNSTNGTVHDSIVYGFVGFQAPYAPPPTTFNVMRTMPLKWQYTNSSGAVVNSAAANPIIIINGPYPCGTSDTAGTITVNDAGASGYQYDSGSNSWQFNWQIKGNVAGCYGISVKSQQSGQITGPFSISVVNK
jgi:hypothetical protein